MEEEHADDSMTRLVESEEINKSILGLCVRRVGDKAMWQQLTTEAAKEPFNQRRR